MTGQRQLCKSCSGNPAGVIPVSAVHLSLLLGVTWSRSDAPTLTLKWSPRTQRSEEQQRASLRGKKGEEKASLSGHSNPTSRLFHLPYKAKARSFPPRLDPLKAGEQSPRLPVEYSRHVGLTETGMSPEKSTAEEAGALQRSMKVTYECYTRCPVLQIF